MQNYLNGKRLGPYTTPSHQWGSGDHISERKHVCPVCAAAFSFPHFERIEVQQFDGKHDMVFESGAASQVDSVANNRGAGVLIVFNGECGHRWSLHLLFHKGDVFEFMRVLEDAKETGEPPYESPEIKDVWRD